MTQPTAAQLKTLITIAADARADGIWLIRGADYASMQFFYPGQKQGEIFTLGSPHELIILLRFPTGDGGETGVEHR